MSPREIQNSNFPPLHYFPQGRIKVSNVFTALADSESVVNIEAYGRSYVHGPQLWDGFRVSVGFYMLVRVEQLQVSRY